MNARGLDAVTLRLSERGREEERERVRVRERERGRERNGKRRWICKEDFVVEG